MIFRLSVTERRRGAALVMVLSLLVLLTFMVVAFFARAITERQVASSNIANEQAMLMARSITEEIVAETLDEMRYGNMPTDVAGATLSAKDRLTKSFPSAASFATPTLVLGANAQNARAFNLVKQSVAGTVSYPQSKFVDGPSDDAKISAKGGSSATPSKSGRCMTPERWNRMGLLPDVAGFAAPDWIRVTRGGPERLGSTFSLADAGDPSNANFVLGRYSYVMANLGGMLDVNVIGNGYPVSDSKNATRRRLHQADFTQIRDGAADPLNESEFRKRLVEWRWGTNAADDAWLFDPKRSFLVPDKNLILSRNELVAFQKKNSDLLIPADLAYLTVGSYEKNAPAFDKENHNASGFDKAANQSLARTFYTAGPKAGQRLFSRRFDLNRIDLLKKGGSTADILKYFGLKQLATTDDWEYAGGTPSGGGFIRTLKDVAADVTNPEPNFFEILKAVINQNTLGVDMDAGKDGAWYAPQEQWRTPDYQIFQIGANIIDQWDADDDPTQIKSSVGDSVWGIENIPYINEMFEWCSSVPRDPARETPTAGRRFTLWFVPEMWNPHRNAADSTVTEFRVVGVGNHRMSLETGPTNTGPWAAGVSAIDLSKCSIEFDTNQPLGTTKFTEPTLIRQGTVKVDPGAGANTGWAVTDTMTQSGADDTKFLGLWAGALPVPDGDKWSRNLALVGSPSYAFDFQYKKNGTWRTYQRLDRFKCGPARGLKDGNRNSFTVLWTLGAISLSDPRSPRGTRATEGDTTKPTADGCSNTLIRVLVPEGGPDRPPKPTTNLFDSNNKLVGTISPESPVGTLTSTGGVGGIPGLLLKSPIEPWPIMMGMALNTNQPLSLDASWALKDRDGQLRFADASTLPVTTDYSVTNLNKGPLTSPAAAAPIPLRPLILNRPFRNIGELGYVSRGQPWKSLNFSLIPSNAGGGQISGQSGDSGLLEAFTLVDAEAVAGKVDLNTRNAPVLKAVLKGSEEWTATPAGTAAVLSDADANSIVSNIVAATSTRPIWTVADLATYVTASSANTAIDGFNLANWIYPKISPSVGMSKDQLEGPLRSLSALGTTRVWNIGLDLVVEVGRYPKNATDPARDFIVESHRRFFVTLVFDRIEGKLISRQIEPVYE